MKSWFICEKVERITEKECSREKEKKREKKDRDREIHRDRETERERERELNRLSTCTACRKPRFILAPSSSPKDTGVNPQHRARSHP